MVSILSIRAISVLIIVVLNSQSYNVNITAVSGSSISGGKSFYNLRIKSLSFGESIPLEYKLHKCLSVLLTTLSETGWLE